MEMTLNNGFGEMSQDEIMTVDGGIGIVTGSLIVAGVIFGAGVITGLCESYSENS